MNTILFTVIALFTTDNWEEENIPRIVIPFLWVVFDLLWIATYFVFFK